MMDAMCSGSSVVTIIAECIKRLVVDVRKERIADLVLQHLRQLRLVDDAGRWQGARLAAIGDWLMCEGLDTSDALAFVDEVARCASANPYLLKFLHRARGAPSARLIHKVRAEGATVLPSVVTYGLLLERLTQSMRDDWRIIDACREMWLRVVHAEDAKAAHWAPFELAKVVSIEIAIERVLRSHASGRVDPAFFRLLLPINIIEAMLEDIRLGHQDNAVGAWPLVKDRPGSWGRKSETGVAAARWSADGKAISLRFALPRQWADLYATWNLAFVSHYRDFPYLMTKLLIPQVNGYQDAPEEYIYNRLLALYSHIHFMGFGRINLSKQGDSPIDWHDDELTKLWSRINRESARKYSRAVKELGRFAEPRLAEL